MSVGGLGRYGPVGLDCAPLLDINRLKGVDMAVKGSYAGARSFLPSKPAKCQHDAARYIPSQKSCES